MPFQPFTGPPKLSEFQRQAIGGLLSSLFPPLGLAYQGLRAGNALYHYIGGLGNKGTSYTPFNDPTDPNNPDAYKLGPDPSGSSVGPSLTRTGGLMNSTQYNQYRPAFSSTYQQLMNPGSAIGPLRGGVGGPYQAGLGHYITQMGQGPTAAASAFSNYVKSRNII